jgi:hypothetical protein
MGIEWRYQGFVERGGMKWTGEKIQELDRRRK